MPQLDQIASTYGSQIFWLLVTFGLIFFTVGLGMVPKIGATVEARDKRISDDLAAAQAAREQATSTEEAYRARTEENRAEALKVTQAAKDKSARETEKKLAKADAALAEQTAVAEAELRSAKDAALAEVEAVAVDAAQDMVAKLSGAKVTKAKAQKAVKAALANG